MSEQPIASDRRSTISVDEIERNRNKTAALDPVVICSTNDFRGTKIRGCALGGGT
jgi:hypothetical protein